jgi:hypothetical protein
MSPHQQKMHWLHTEEGLVLRTRGDSWPVPDAVAEHLTGPRGLGVLTNPAEDLVRLEWMLRRRALIQDERVVAAAADVAEAQAERNRLSDRRGFRARRDLRKVAARLHTAATEHAAATEIDGEIRDTIDHVRGFVLGLDLLDGLLAESAAGWRRSPQMPSYVVEFADEQAFLTADQRRTMNAAWGGAMAGGEDFGAGWRRDGDDDLRTTPHVGGTWALGFIPRTG